MDGTASKTGKGNKIASFETQYRESVLSKPKNISVTVTADGIFGSAYICDQIGTREDEFYDSFECGLDAVTKVYINVNKRSLPVYIQCADSSTGTMNQRRIILPGFSEADKNAIIATVERAKADYDERPDKDSQKGFSQAAVYSEKRLAFYETQYRENMMSTPYDINVTVTPLHVYGSGYICNRTGIREDDPVYGKFTLGYEEISKIYINNNHKLAPVYIQCGDDNTGNKTSKRIILPKFDDDTKNKIVKAVEDAKAEFDEKEEFRRESERRQKLSDIEARRKAQDDEFESMTNGYEEMFRREKPQPAPAQEAATAPERPAPRAAAPEHMAEPAPRRTEPKPAPAPAPRPAPAPAPSPAPAPQRTEPRPAPAPAPSPAPAPQRTEPKPAPSPAPAPQRTEPRPAPAPAPQRTEPRPAPAPKPAPAPAPRPAPAPAPIPDQFPDPFAEQPTGMQELSSGSVTVDDILSLDEFLGINADSGIAAESYMDEITEGPDEAALDAMPEETIQKNPDKIEGLAIPRGAEHLEEVKDERPAPSAIEELNTIEEIAKKLNPKPKQAPAPAPEPVVKQEPAPAPKPAPAPAAEPAPAPKPEPNIVPEAAASGEDMSLEDFETAVKKLKTMLDNGVITESEFAVEKKKLFKLLY